MLGLLLRLSTSFGNQAAKNKTILLSLHSPLQKYSFLAIPSSRITSDLLPLVQPLSSPVLEAFLEITRSNLHLLTQIGRDNFGFVQLIKLEEGELGQSQILSKHSAELKTWADSFEKLTEAVQCQINRSNFSQWMEICLRLELIDLAVWGVLLRQCAAGFAQLPPSRQLQTIGMVHSYVSQKFMKFTYAPSRFVYRENSLVDLGNLPELLTIFARAVVTAPVEQARPCFSFFLELAFKVSKTCLVNFMTLLNHYSENEGAYLELVKNGPLSSHIHLLRFYALIGLNDRDRLCNLDNSFLGQLNSHQHSLQLEQIFGIVASWSSLSHHSSEIHQKHIRPAILRLLKDPKHRSSPKWTTLLFDLLGAGVEDLDILEALLGHIAQAHPIDSKIMHTVNHYLSVKQKSTRLSSYPLCEQHPVAIAIASSAPKVYSPCMVRQRRKDGGHSHQDITFQKQIGIENNPPQSFWLQALKEVFQELSAQQPHPDNGIFFNFPFCVFELDALIVLGNRYVAFELAGTHYLHKDEKGRVGDSWQGKKQIKNAIVQAYGITPCDINSSGLVERTISSFQDYSHARKYLREKLLPLLKAD